MRSPQLRRRGPAQCSVVSPSSTVVRPPCGSSTPSGSWPRRPGHGSRPSPCTPTSTGRPRSSARRTSPTTSVPPPPAVPGPAVLERALVETGADAAWVGWGFVAEDPAFAELCDEIGVTFVGPSAEAMRKLGDKIGAKLIAEEVGVPVAPWSRGRGRDPGRRAGGGGRIGYPLMLKATAGGGGRGIRVVTNAAELADAYERTSQEAARAFGSGVVFLERLVTGRPARRGAGDRGRPGHRVGARRPRLLGAAAQPEDHRGVGLAGARRRAGRRAQGVGRAAGPRGRLPRRGAPSSSSTTPATGCSRSSRSTPACRSSTRSPSPPPGSTWSRRSCTWRRAAGSRATPPGERGHAVEARLNAEDPDRDFAPVPRPHRAAGPAQPAPASGWTPASARATRSPPTSTR